MSEHAKTESADTKLPPDVEKYIDEEILFLRKAGLAGDLDVMADRAMERLNRKHEDLRDIESELDILDYDIKKMDKTIDKWCKPQRKLLSRLLVLVFKIRKPFDTYYDEFEELKKKRSILEARKMGLLDEIDEDTDLAKRAASCRRALSDYRGR